MSQYSSTRLLITIFKHLLKVRNIFHMDPPRKKNLYQGEQITYNVTLSLIMVAVEKK